MIDLEQCGPLLIEATGGAELWEAARLHYGDGHTLAQVSEWVGVPVSTLQRRLVRLRGLLASHGQLPRGWRRQNPGRAPKPTIISTDAELYDPNSHKSG